MPAYPCPACGRALNLRDDVLGAQVQCPLCATEFQAPDESPTPPRPRRELPPPTAAAGRSQSPQVPFDYRDDGHSASGPYGQAALKSSAFWLQIAVALQGVSGLLCCCGPALDGGKDALAFTVPLTVALKYVPLLIGLIASIRLPARRSRGLCRAAAVLLIWTSVVGLLEAFIGFVVLLVESRHSHSAGETLTLLFALVGLPGAVCGFIASVKVMNVLGKPGIAGTFR